MTNRSVGEADTDTTSCVTGVMWTICTKSLEHRLRSHLRTQVAEREREKERVRGERERERISPND